MLCANTGTAFAQKLTKAEKKAQKQERLEEQKELIKAMYEIADFKFVPSEVSTPTSTPQVITKHNAVILKPNYLNIDLVLPNPSLSSKTIPNQPLVERATVIRTAEKLESIERLPFQFTTSQFEIVKNEATKKGYMMVIETEVEQERCSLTFKTNAKTGSTTLVLSRDQWSGYTYKGVISPN